MSAKKVIKKRSKKRTIPAALTNFSTLAAALDRASDEAKNTAARRRQLAGKGFCKKRTVITSQETVRLQQVLAHPQYQADPFAAIQSQLQATLPAPSRIQHVPDPKLLGKLGAKGKRKHKRMLSHPASSDAA